MASERAVVALLALQLTAWPVLAATAGAQDVGARAAVPDTCGNDAVDLGEQCDGADDTGCPGMCSAACACPPVTTVDIPSGAAPPNTPGSPDVVVTNPKLLAQYGAGVSLNNARYTRFQLDDSGAQPDAILILVPGFLGGASNFRILAQNLLARAKADHDLVLEVWAVDRRTNQLEDTAGLDIAEAALDTLLAENWLFGEELSLPLDPRLSRRAVFYNAQDDVPFLANWTNLVFSRDIDAIVEAALAQARDGNVFLGGHSAGTGFTARYAATDFNITASCAGVPEPGYKKLRGLVLLEGAGGSTAGDDPTDDGLDRIIAKFDGGLYGAVRDNAPRCVDGTTPCTVATETADCAGQMPAKCTPPTTAYASVPGALNPRVLAVSEATAIQSALDLNGGQAVTQLDVGAPGNNLLAKVPDVAGLAVILPSTVEAAFGTFLSKNGPIGQALSFVAMSIGQPGPTVNDILTWRDILHGPLDPGPDLGPPPTTLPAGRWGMDKQVTRLDRVLWAFFAGQTNFSDWYYPSAGPSTTSGIGLDSTRLSAPPPLGRGRCDIENLTQAGGIDIPVIAFSGSAGSAPVPGVYTAFAQSIGPCAAASCDQETPRVVDASSPNPAFPTFGDVAGGFQVFVNEGFAHLDVLTAEDNADNHVIEPLSDFIARNAEPTASPVCTGDCDGNGSVTIDELVRGVGIALGSITADQCPAFDCHSTGSVPVDCLVAGVSGSLTGCVTSGCLTDLDADGVMRIGCAGDSNTTPVGSSIQRWCERAQAQLSSATVHVAPDGHTATEPVQWMNVAVGGTTACDQGIEQAGQLIAAKADAIIAAFGTNDLFLGTPIESVVGCYQAVEAYIAPLYVALTPPMFPPAPNLNAAVEALNTRLRQVFENRAIDFHDGFHSGHFTADGLHLNDAGQAIRAQRAIVAVQQ